MIFAVVIVSAGAEWRIVRELHPSACIQRSPYGEWFAFAVGGQDLVFLQGGWGKISAAASTQYALLAWQPKVLINMGTCGGFEGQIERGEVILASRTLVYDIIERMTDPVTAIQHYTVDLDPGWLQGPFPHPVRTGLLVSADQDISPHLIEMLQAEYGAVAADWESGAIAWVCSKNSVPCLILRGVSDLVGTGGGEAYLESQVFRDGARRVMEPLLQALPQWLKCIQ